MKSIITLLGMFLALCGLATAGTKGDWGREACRRNHPAVVVAIERFCNKSSKMFIPSTWGKNGARSQNAFVRITGSCNPMQYVPWDICFQQFYDICAAGNKRGEGSWVFGSAECQRWTISNPY